MLTCLVVVVHSMPGMRLGMFLGATVALLCPMGTGGGAEVYATRWFSPVQISGAVDCFSLDHGGSSASWEP